MESNQIQTAEMVFVGRRVSNGKRVYDWANLDNLDTYLSWSKNIAPASVGGVYLVSGTFTDTTTSVMTQGSNGPRYLRRLEDERVIIWAARDEAAAQQLATKSMNTKAAKVDPLDDLLMPLMKAAAGMNDVERRALVTRVISAVMYA